MSDQSGIEWTDATWNPVRGCSRVSEGCRHCYAEAIAARFSLPGNTFHGFAERTPEGPRWTGDVVLLRDRLKEPLTWKTPRRVFVNSMSDLFHENLPDDAIDQVFAVMSLAPQHTFQVLTKRAERMRMAMLRLGTFNFLDCPACDGEGEVHTVVRRGEPSQLWPCRSCAGAGRVEPRWPLPNVWLGVSVENQHFADERIPLLLATPAAVRFISAEPLLGPVDISPFIDKCSYYCDHGEMWPEGHRPERGLDWVIVGGESGPGARPFDLEWGYQILAQCRAAGVACFVKQIGSNPRPIKKPHHPKGGDMAEWPAGLRVREFPRGTPDRVGSIGVSDPVAP